MTLDVPVQTAMMPNAVVAQKCADSGKHGAAYELTHEFFSRSNILEKYIGIIKTIIKMVIY